MRDQVTILTEARAIDDTPILSFENKCPSSSSTSIHPQLHTLFPSCSVMHLYLLSSPQPPSLQLTRFRCAFVSLDPVDLSLSLQIYLQASASTFYPGRGVHVRAPGSPVSRIAPLCCWLLPPRCVLGVCARPCLALLLAGVMSVGVCARVRGGACAASKPVEICLDWVGKIGARSYTFGSWLLCDVILFCVFLS
jgi:hypothetical protein